MYQIYIEYIFLLNFVFLYSVWNASLELFFCTVTQKKLLAASFFGAMVSCICLFLPAMLWWRLFFGAILAFLVSKKVLFFATKKSMQCGRYISITFLTAILLGGSIALLQKQLGDAPFSVLQMAGLSVTISFIIKILLHRYLPTKAKHLYGVTLVCEGKEYKMKGLLDTGNGLIEPISKKAVCIVGREVFEKCGKDLNSQKEKLQKEKLQTEEFRKEFLPEKFRVIPYHSVGKENGILYGYEMDCLLIETDEKKIIIERPMIGLSEVSIGSPDTYQMILQPELLREGEI